MLEIDDAEYQRLQAADALMKKLLNTPKTKRQTEKLVKEVFPETVITEDYEAPLVEKIDSLANEFKEWRTSNKQREEDAATTAAFERLKSDGYTDEGIDWIKKQMIDRKIADPDAAAALYDKTHPPEPQKPGSYLPESWGIGAPTGGDKNLDLLYKDEDAWSDQEVTQFFNEQRVAQGKR